MRVGVVCGAFRPSRPGSLGVTHPGRSDIKSFNLVGDGKEIRPPIRNIPLEKRKGRDAMAIDLKTGGIQAKDLARYQAAYRERPEHRTITNAILANGINAVAIDHEKAYQLTHTFSLEIETGPITNQKQSGRCWLFAGLNFIRTGMAKRIKFKDLELSQSYLMFWDKLEKANYFLESMLATLDEETSGRLVSWLTKDPLQDGGQWDMFVNLVEKYGVVPKSVMPESFHSSQSHLMNNLLTVKLRENAAKLRAGYQAGESVDALHQVKEQMVGEFYGMLCHFLGEPPTSFNWEYRDDDKGFHADNGLTPEAFFRRYADCDLTDYVSVIHAPTEDKPFGHTYTVQYLGNVVGGRPVLYLNLPIERMREVALAQLTAQEPVWFGCDVGKMAERKQGALDPDQFNYGLALGVEFGIDKAQRLDYGDSQMTHAMVFTGVNLDADGHPNRWKVENSWGKEAGQDGFYVMSDRWFEEYMYQVVVSKKYLTENEREILSSTPRELAPWDPMGSLA